MRQWCNFRGVPSVPYRGAVTVEDFLRLVAHLEAIGGYRPPRPGYRGCPWERLSGSRSRESEGMNTREPKGPNIVEHIAGLSMNLEDEVMIL